MTSDWEYLFSILDCCLLAVEDILVVLRTCFLGQSVHRTVAVAADKSQDSCCQDTPLAARTDWLGWAAVVRRELLPVVAARTSLSSDALADRTAVPSAVSAVAREALLHQNNSFFKIKPQKQES